MDKIQSSPSEVPLGRSEFEFLNRFFPNATQADWSDWKWQIKNSICDYQELTRLLELDQSEEELTDLNIPMRITPYYMSLFYNKSKNNPLRKTMVPSISELIEDKYTEVDSLHEEDFSPIKSIVHRYPDRVLFLVTDFCAGFCRYCTRQRLVTDECQENLKQRWEAGFEYIKNNPQIRDVLISGGDPLTLSDHNLEYIISRVREIEHVEMIRIGTKVPIVLPQRVTDDLVNMLKKYHPLFMNIHVAHLDEITPESAVALRKLADAGIPLGSQTVLLKNVNDDSKGLSKMFTTLLKNRVRPYYLYQCDLVSGTTHFRTEILNSVNILKDIRGYITGLAVPTFVIDAPKGGGKVPIQPDYIQGSDNEFLYFKNYKDELYSYPLK